MTNKLLTRAVLAALLFVTWTTVERLQGFNAKAIVAAIGVTAVVSWLVLVRAALNRAAQN